MFGDADPRTIASLTQALNDKNILETPNNSYLSGYWQSEKYFNNIIDILKNDFQFKIPMSSYNIDTYNIVSIYVEFSCNYNGCW